MTRILKLAAGKPMAMLAVATVALLSGYLLYPALFLDRSLVHEDNLHHGYALLKFQHDVIHNGLSPQWTNLVYGGHALFAEGQAGLSNPVNYLVAWLFAPEFGHNLIHWLAMVIFGSGCYGLARSLSIGPMASFIATLAATFSGLTLHTNSNIMGISALAWIPWTLWAFECWLKVPDQKRSIAFGLCVAMLVFSGYPQFLQGTVIYMAVSMLTLPMAASLRSLAQRYWRGGILAICVCVGISSIQWLPLLELASLSHRKEGLAFTFSGTTTYMLQGLLYTLDITEGDQTNPYFPNTGSLVVCFFALMVLTVPTSIRIKGHMIATLLLLNLGLGEGSPVYTLAKTYHLIPGMSNFRITFPYFAPSLVGIAMLASCCMDRISELDKDTARHWLRSWRAAVVLLVFCTIVFVLHSSRAPTTHYIICALALLGLGFLTGLNQLRYLPALLALLLLTEIWALKITPFETVPNAEITSPPPLASQIVSQEGFEQFKHYHTGLTALTFASPYSSKLSERTAHEMQNLVASTNLLWGIPSFSAALALKSYRKPIANDVVANDISGRNDKLPHARLMDVMSIRWVSKKNTETSEYLTPYKDDEGRQLAWENTRARPLIQIYQNAQAVDGPQAAADIIERDGASTLYIEGHPPDQATNRRGDPMARVDLRKHHVSAAEFELSTSASSGFWLFLADTYHPGWKATISEEPTPVYPAQVLGKAVYVPPGRHNVRIYFQSDAFLVGAIISCLTLVILVLYGAFQISVNRLKSR